MWSYKKAQSWTYALKWNTLLFNKQEGPVIKILLSVSSEKILLWSVAKQRMM